jgi:uncharacterized protein (TIGR02757 family)
MKFRTKLDKLYAQYNRPELIHPDPLEFLGCYDDVGDREIAGLVAATLAYGKVAQILKSVRIVLDGMKPTPYAFLRKSSRKQISNVFKDFKHRFTTGADLTNFLLGAKNAIKQYGSLNACFLNGYSERHDTVQPALASFVNALKKGGGETNLLSDPEKGSACKRLHLFLRWMVRKDDVDPGGWKGIPRSKLIVPLDTHMHKIGLGFKMTKRRQGSLRTAMEITEAFARICPDDPVKYDFALTRFGIRDDMKMEEMFGLCRGE